MHIQMSEAAGLSWPLEVPEDLKNNRWFPLLCRREAEIVVWGHIFGYRCIDFSQMLKRATFSKTDIFPTLLPKAHLWLYFKDKINEDRPLLGREALALQGIPWKAWPNPEGLTEGEMFNLAGNAFSSTTAMVAVTLAIFGPDLASPCTDDEAEALDRIATAMQNLQRLVPLESVQSSEDSDSD
jgi:hypothetical protein